MYLAFFGFACWTAIVFTKNPNQNHVDDIRGGSRDAFVVIEKDANPRKENHKQQEMNHSLARHKHEMISLSVKFQKMDSRHKRQNAANGEEVVRR
jgi:hypothetical protein